MLQTLLTKIGIPALIGVLSDTLRRVDHPAARGAAEALGEVDEALSLGQISPEQMIEANRHVEKLAEIELRRFETTLAEINQSLRAEVASEDKYVRRMRPTFGYLMAATWAAQMFGVAYIIVFRTEEASLVLEAVESLSMIWTVGLSVLGIYVYKRSEDKRG